MKPGELDRELNRLREASERVAANLVELEIDSSRQLLEASTLSGESARSWSEASAALSDLWQWRGLLEAYQVKAARLGAIEDPALERIFAEAHEALHRGPYRPGAGGPAGPPLPGDAEQCSRGGQVNCPHQGVAR